MKNTLDLRPKKYQTLLSFAIMLGETAILGGVLFTILLLMIVLQ